MCEGRNSHSTEGNTLSCPHRRSKTFGGSWTKNSEGPPNQCWIFGVHFGWGPLDVVHPPATPLSGRLDGDWIASFSLYSHIPTSKLNKRRAILVNRHHELGSCIILLVWYYWYWWFGVFVQLQWSGKRQSVIWYLIKGNNWCDVQYSVHAKRLSGNEDKRCFDSQTGCNRYLIPRRRHYIE